MVQRWSRPKATSCRYPEVARHFFRALLTLSLLRSACGKSFVSSWSRVRKENDAEFSRGSDVFVFAGGLLDDPACPSDCLKCSDGECLRCTNSKYLDPRRSTCEEKCPDGYYPEGTGKSNRTCTRCASDCSICKSASECVQCMSSKYLSPTGVCGPSCPIGYYKHGGEIGPGVCRENACEPGKESVYLTHKKEGMPACPSSHYPSDSDESGGRFCIECPGSCSECTGPHSCTQCKAPNFLTAHGTCEASCQEGYYAEVGREVHRYWGVKVGGACKSCPENCNRCIGTGCAECNKFTYLDPNGECVERCPDGYFGAGVEELGRVCKQCPGAHGQQCLNSTFVLECGENTYLDPWNTTCVESCPSGYFGLEGDVKELGGPKIGGTCENCLGACKRCSSATTCDVCKDGMYLNPLTERCSMSCPNDHYMSGRGNEGRVCKPCPSIAASCVNETFVFQCRGNNQYLVPEGGSCTTQCPDGYFGRAGVQVEEDGPLIGGTCERCVGSCGLCKSEAECVQCKGGMYLDPTTLSCSFECPRDHFMFGTGETGRVCKACPDNFAMCRNATFALECRGDQQYLVPDGGQCTSSCLDGYYARSGIALEENGPLVGGTCERCVAPCETCSSTTECKICKGGTYLNPYDFHCRFDCPPQTYMTGTGDTGRKCEACPPEMYTCVNTTYATLCHGDNYYLTPVHTCEMQCPEGYFKMGGYPEYEGGPMVGGSCQKCVHNCKTCFTASQCTSCRNGTYFNPREELCGFSCPEDHYMVGKGEEGRLCVRCPEEFHSCLNATWGTHCRGDNKYLTDKGSCVSTCPAGYFRRTPNITMDGLLIGGTCEKCVGDCEECSSEGECVMCQNSKFLKNGTCVSTCPDGFFSKSGKDGINGTCELCVFGASCKVVKEVPTRSWSSGGSGFMTTRGTSADYKAMVSGDDMTVELMFKLLEKPNMDHGLLIGTKSKPTNDDISADLLQFTVTVRSTGELNLVIAGKGQYQQYHSDPSHGVLDNAWHHLAVVFRKSAKDVKVYVDGTNVVETNSMKEVGGTSFSAELVIGTGDRSYQNSKYIQSAQFARLLLWKRALASDEFRDKCSEAGLVAAYSFDGSYENSIGGNPAFVNTQGDFVKDVYDTSRVCEYSKPAGQPATGPEPVACEFGFVLKNSECVNTCPAGQYKEPDTEACVACPDACASCVNGQKCILCKNDAALDVSELPHRSSCVPRCPDGHFADKGQCRPCSTSCSKCTSSSMCTECKDARYLTPTQGSAACADDCPDGHYPFGTNATGRTCRQCSQDCLKCTAAGKCQECGNHKSRAPDGGCEDGCPQGYYRKGDGENGRTCEICPGDFFNCIDSNQGTECRNRKYLTARGTCENGCPMGTYPAGTGDVGRHCLPCGSNCAVCSTGDTCDRCTNSVYLTPDHWCEESCPDGYYKNGTGKLGRTCEICPTASKCISPTVATECRDFKYLTNGTCAAECPEGTYPAGHGSIGRSCQVCSANCASCKQANLCLQCRNSKYLSADMWCEESCPDGYFRNGTGAVGRTCARCPDSAMKCIGPALITECRDWLYLTPDGACAPSCPKGTYPFGISAVGRRCESCDKDCAACTRENECKECMNGKYLSPSSWCEASCPHGTYRNGTGAVGNTCDPCPGDTSACINPEYATECKHFKFLTPAAQCSDTCPHGYYPGGSGEVGRHCPRCHENCYSCSASSLCTVCDNGKFLSPNMWCDDTCPDGYYRNGSSKTGNTCPACPQHASKCVNATHSVECKDSRYLNPDFTCKVDCPRGLFQQGESTTGRVCSQCSSNCTLCVNGTTCTECKNNLYLSPDFWCEEECPSDHYYEPAPSLKRIEWKKLPDQSCGGNDLLQWSGGGDARYGEQFVENVAGCQLMCMARAECAGFELRDDSNRCSFWKSGPLSPREAKGIHCYRKESLAPSGKSNGEVVVPAAGRASMSSSLETTSPRFCNDGLVATRCSSTWNDAAGELNPWWQMDLAANESVVKIRILSDPDGCEALSEDSTGLHCSLLGGVVGVSKTPCEKGKLCEGTVCGTLTEVAESWYEVSCDRAEGRYVFLQLKGYRVLNFYELVAYKVSKSESCTETWQLTNVVQKGSTFTSANQNGGHAFAVAGPVSGISFKPGQDDRPLWVGLTTDPTDERDFKGGRFIHLTMRGSIEIEGAAAATYTTEDFFRLELKGREIIIQKNGATLFSYDLGGSTTLSGWYALLWFPEADPNYPAVSVDEMQTTCFPLQEGVGGTCVKCPCHASRCVNASMALECKNEMYLRRTNDCAPECPLGDFPTDGSNGVGGYCSQCHENCRSCLNATTCLSCKNQYYLTHDSKCAPECAQGFYAVKGQGWEDGLGGQCKACPENCSACNNGEECTECRLYTYRTPSATCTSSCPDTYYKNGTEKIGGECLPCAENCLQCTSDYICTVCNSSLFLAQSGICVEHCPDGEYEVGEEEIGRECKRCPKDFNKCITATYASECKHHLYLTPDAQCEPVCPDGFYRAPLSGTPIGRQCPRCPEDCSKCEAGDTCSECKNGMYLSPDLWCQPECPTGYYKVGSGEIGNTCAKCPVGCRACIDSERCTECMDFKYLSPSRQCVETCPLHTFPEGDGEAGRVCSYCQEHCHNCATATHCLECNNSMHLDDRFQCVCACRDGFYAEGEEDRGRSCASCPTYCGICTGPEVCLECAASLYLNPNSTCQAGCPDGFYKQGQNETGRICPRCFHTCSKCDSADICTECKNFTFLTPDSKCNYECPAGYWERGTEEFGGICELCSDNCLECSSFEVCELCKNGRFLDTTSGTCKTECPDGFWGKIPDPNADIGRTCEICAWPCNKCTEGGCTECKDSSYLTPFDACEYTCPPGYYPSGVGEINITCQPCSADCATCDTSEVCTACKNGKFLNPDGSCQDICPDGYWQLPALGGVGNTCPLCAENCSLCTSPSVCQECRNSTYLTHYDWCEIECQDGYFEEGAGDLGRVCKVCPSTCNKCEAEDHCTECKSSLYLTSDHLCQRICPIGYYPNRDRAVGGECETCPEQCAQCSSTSTCSECKNGLYLTPTGWCEEGCPTGYYAKEGTSGVGGACPMCPENCQACNSAEECTVCRNFTHLTAYGQCRSECPGGYYQADTGSIGGTCNRCPFPCNLCESATMCTECAGGSYLTPSGTCGHRCPEGYHFEGNEDIGRFCKACPPTCATCSSQESCTLCQNYTYMTPSHSCEYSCPDGHYRHGVQEFGNTCPRCPGHMQRCINTTYATECKNSHYLTPLAKCEEGCPDGFFELGRGEVGRMCPRCAQNCTFCSNATTCQECKNGQYLTHTDWCDHECPDGYYKFGDGDVGRKCKSCKTACNSCNTCLGPHQCTECNEGTFLTPWGKCAMACPPGYYAQPGSNGVGGTCAICPENCDECVAESQCTVCSYSSYLHNHTCKPRCPDGWFHFGEGTLNRECVSCKPGCSQCSNETFCTECKDGLFLTPSGECDSTCPDGFFALPGEEAIAAIGPAIGGVCQLCAENCTKCEWWDRCSECKASKFLTHYGWCADGT